MPRWTLVVLLALQAHFAASYIVPLDAEAQGAFGGLLRWFWPWGFGDGGPLGRVVQGADPQSPVAGFFLAAVTFLLFALAALSAAGVWVPAGWWRPLAAVGAVLLVCLMALFFGPTKLVPIAVALGTLYLVLAKPAAFAAG
jgi:hypothetical protein